MRIGAIRRRTTVLVLLAGVSPLIAQSPEDRERRRSPIVHVFEQCRDAVVNISTTRVVRSRSLLDEVFDIRPPRVGSVGSGFIIHPSGYVVTNAHVVAQTSDVRVTFADQSTMPAEIVSVDTEHDLAVLKIAAPRPLPHTKLGRSDDILIGETVVAIGNPLGLQHSVTTGIISALDRELRFRPDAVYRGLIQTDAAINPGNSGGPLFNINGELIGINTAIRGDAQNVGFAIPVDRLWVLLPNLLDVERQKRVRFGVQVSGPDAIVAAVDAGSPGAQAGLEPGDRVRAFNGEAIRDSIDYYVHLLEQQPGGRVRLSVDRDGRSSEVQLALEPVPMPDGADLALNRLGMRVEPIPDAVRRRYELPPAIGLVVAEVERRSPAEQADLEPGDVLLRVDRLPVPTLNDLGLALERVGAGEKLLVEGLTFRADGIYSWAVSPRTR